MSATPAARKQRMAGAKMIDFMVNNPLGEELTEGVLGGLMAGAAQIGQDQPLEQTALNTALAMAGGVGLGMAGRRIGEAIGNRVHAGALKNQNSLLATVARSFGSETTAKGIKNQGVAWKGAIQDDLVNKTSAKLAKEAMEDPKAFARKYGVDPASFLDSQTMATVGLRGAGVAQALESMPQEQRVAMAKQLMDNPQFRKFATAEDLIASQAASGIDENIKAAAERLRRMEAGEEINGVKMDAKELEAMRESLLKGKNPSEVVESLTNPVEDVTGGHVGKMLGRFIGDEVGILGGLAAGAILGQQMGIESPKDRTIRQLQAQLGQAQA